MLKPGAVLAGAPPKPGCAGAPNWNAPPAAGVLGCEAEPKLKLKPLGCAPDDPAGCIAVEPGADSDADMLVDAGAAGCPNTKGLLVSGVWLLGADEPAPNENADVVAAADVVGCAGKALSGEAPKDIGALVLKGAGAAEPKPPNAGWVLSALEAPNVNGDDAGVCWAEAPKVNAGVAGTAGRAGCASTSSAATSSMPLSSSAETTLSVAGCDGGCTSSAAWLPLGSLEYEGLEGVAAKAASFANAGAEPKSGA